MSTVVSAVLGFAILLSLVSLFVPLARRMGLPYTVLIAALGAGLGFLALLGSEGNGVLSYAASSLQQLRIPSDGFFYVFLPPLLFAGGLTVDVRRLMDDVAPVLVLAVIAVLFCMLAVGLSLWLVTGAALLWCLMLGAIVATTDTAAVLSIFRDIGAPGRLTVIVEGESLFNDAAAIAIFFVLQGMLLSGAEFSLFEMSGEFAKGLIGGLLWGYLVARVYCWAIGQFRTGIVSEITLSVSLAYFTFVTAQAFLLVSGIIAVVVAAMTFVSSGRTKLSPGTWDTLLVTWKQLEFWATSLIFVLASMLTPKMLSEFRLSDLIGIATIFFAALIARATVMWGIFPLLTLAGIAQAISSAYKAVLCWGSLRGAVTAALALSVSENAAVEAVAPGAGRFIFVLAMGYVLATLFVAAPTLRPLMRILRLDKLTPQERLVRDRVMAMSRGRVREALVSVSQGLGMTMPLVAAQASGKLAPVEDIHAELSQSDLARAGLIVAANREAEMSLEYLQRGVVGRRIAERLRSDASAVLDGVRSNGAQGYIKAALSNQNPSWSFRSARWLHRRFSWTGPLSDEIAGRFELLIVEQLMLGELQIFAKEKIASLIGGESSSEVNAALSARQEAISGAIAALDLQYSEFTQAMRSRFLERLSISLEEAEYRNQHDQNLISNEVYEDLEENRRRRKSKLEHRPPLNLGLELAEMLMKVPMFVGLDQTQIGRLAQLLTTHLAVPGEAVIKTGETGDRMFFIASGTVDVIVAGQVVRKLERGDFVGEMALLTNQRRNADVISSGYANLLSLERRDFDVFLRNHPQLKARIEAEAAERLAQNLKAAVR
jgi:CPA1 family monovalent cation:H+ antiporter